MTRMATACPLAPARPAFPARRSAASPPVLTNSWRAVGTRRPFPRGGWWPADSPSPAPTMPPAERSRGPGRCETRDQRGGVVRVLVARLVVPRRVQPEMHAEPLSQEPCMATGPETSPAPRAHRNPTRPPARTAEDRGPARGGAGQRRWDGLKSDEGRCAARFARSPWLARVGPIDCGVSVLRALGTSACACRWDRSTLKRMGARST
jgi:hypothetical protein